MNFAGGRFQGTDFSHADLTGAYFGPRSFSTVPPYVSVRHQPAILDGARFDDAVLLAATYNYASVVGASFDRAYLGLTNFRNIVFERTSFRAARLLNTAFCDCAMDGMMDTDTIEHSGPSHVDVATMLRSRLPELFLTRVGISRSLIEYLPSLRTAQSPIRFYSCFLSHSTSDRAFCDALYASLTAAGTSVWYAPEDMQAGRLMHQQIDAAINHYDKLIIVLSEASMRSTWVANEILRARRRESASGRQVLFPISIVPHKLIREWQLVDPETGTDLASLIRGYYIPQFPHPQSMDAALFGTAHERLLRDLRAGEPPEILTSGVS